MKKKQRSIKPLLQKTFFFIFLLLPIAGFIFIFKSNLFTIKQIDCQRDNFPCRQEIMVFLQDLRGKNIFLADTKLVEKKIIDYFVEIEDVKIEKRLLNKLIVRIVSRQPFAALTQQEKVWFLVDREFFVYKKVFEKPKELPIVVSLKKNFFLGKEVDDESLKQTLELVSELQKNYLSFKKIKLLQKDNLQIFLNEPIVASFSARKSINKQVDSLQFILRQSKIEGKLPVFIDLRFKKPLVKF